MGRRVRLAELPGRLLVLALTAGAYASVVSDLRAVAAVSGLAVAVFVGFLANRYGELTGGRGGRVVACRL